MRVRTIARMYRVIACTGVLVCEMGPLPESERRVYVDTVAAGVRVVRAARVQHTSYAITRIPTSYISYHHLLRPRGALRAYVPRTPFAVCKLAGGDRVGRDYQGGLCGASTEASGAERPHGAELHRAAAGGALQGDES